MTHPPADLTFFNRKCRVATKSVSETVRNLIPGDIKKKRNITQGGIFDEKMDRFSE